jgi:hypothetical protein
MLAPMVRPSVALLLALSVFPGCGASKARTTELSSGAAEILERPPDVYSPRELRLPSDALGGVRGPFEEQLSPATRESVRHEPALDLAAAVFARLFADRAVRPSPLLAQWIFWKSGVVGAYRSSYPLRAGGRNRSAFLSRYTSWFGRTLEPGTMAYGIERTSNGTYDGTAIVVAWQPAIVEPFPKSPAPGSTLPLRLQARAGYDHFVAHLAKDEKTVLSFPMEKSQDGSYAVDVPVPSTPGRYFLEVQALEPLEDANPEGRWNRPILWVPLYAGVPEPREPEPWMHDASGNPPDPSTWAAVLTDRYNAARRQAEVPPLSLDTAMSELARDRLAELQLRSKVPPDPKAKEKLAARGLRVKGVRQRQTTFYRVADLAEGSLHRPGRMLDFLAAKHTLFGVAFAKDPTSGEEPRYRVVEYLAEAE